MTVLNAFGVQNAAGAVDCSSKMESRSRSSQVSAVDFITEEPVDKKSCRVHKSQGLELSRVVIGRSLTQAEILHGISSHIMLSSIVSATISTKVMGKRKEP
ncbi:hypothetical protein TRVL_06958 [Trypanosoma vivax]|nr:hypothetical protein TRVL_06958 [Trypanosoma vivax]